MFPKPPRRPLLGLMLVSMLLQVLVLAVFCGVAYAQPTPTPAPPVNVTVTATWLAVAAALIHLLVGALQANSFNAMLAKFSIPAVPAAAFPWIGVVLGFGSGLVGGLQQGQAIGAAAATAMLGLVTGALSAMHAETMGTTDAKKDDSKSAAASPPPRGFSRVGLVATLSALALVACGLFGQVAPPAADCGLAIAVDASKGMTIAQIYADVSGRCGQDLSAIVTALLASQDPAVTSSTAFAEAVKLKASVLAAGGAK